MQKIGELKNLSFFLIVAFISIFISNLNTILNGFSAKILCIMHLDFMQNYYIIFTLLVTLTS